MRITKTFNLVLEVQITSAADNIFMFWGYGIFFSENKASRQFMKCQVLFSLKNDINRFIMASATKAFKVYIT